MEWFETKKALLTYLGKNPDDRKLVDRLIAKWEVWVENGMYYVKEGVKEEKKTELKEEVVVDDKELKELREKNEKLIAAYKSLKDRHERMLEGYKKAQEKADEEWGLYDHLVFFYWKFREWKKFVEWKVFWEAEHKKNVEGTQDTMETVRPYMYERYKFTYWEIEDAECAAVEKIIAKRWEELSELPF